MLPRNKTNGHQSSKITNVEIQRVFRIILEKRQANLKIGLLKASGRKVAISYYKNTFVFGKLILKIYKTYKQKKGRFNIRKLNL